MKKPRLAVASTDRSIEQLVSRLMPEGHFLRNRAGDYDYRPVKRTKLAAVDFRANHRKMVIWAADCAKRALPYFEQRSPDDDRPRKAIEAARAWTETGAFKMTDVRKASLAAHAAAREVEQNDAARSAARAAGQAVAATHAPMHAIAAALYAATAVRHAAKSTDADTATIKERDWQYRRLLELAEKP